MARHSAIALSIAAALLFVGEYVSAQKPVERDSAGIRIIENPSRATAAVMFRLGAPTLDIGGPADNPDDEFAPRGVGVVGMPLSDGTIAVSDVVRIRYFDAKGRLIATLGRSGAGPGEFRSLGAMEFCRTRGDTVVAGDLRNGRFAVVNRQRVVRTIAYTSFGGSMIGCFDDGTVLMRGGLPNWKTPEYTMRINRLKLDGTPINDFGDLVFRSPSPLTGFQYPTVKVWAQRVYVGDGATSEIRVYRADGRLTHIVRSADAAKQITAADAERLLSAMPTPSRQLWRPETYQTYADFLIDLDGRLWVKDFVSPFFKATDRVGWTAFDPDGRIIGRLEVPRTIGKSPFSVVAFGRNEMQVLRADEDGFKHLTFYPILR